MKSTQHIENIRDFIEFTLNCCDVDYECQYQEDDNGYVYSIVTEYAFGIFSDSGSDGFRMFILNNQMYNWGIKEELTENQMTDLKMYIPINLVSEFIEYLSTPKLKPIDI